jgi:hypothetical protein
MGDHPRAAPPARHPLKGAMLVDWQSQIHGILSKDNRAKQ